MMQIKFHFDGKVIVLDEPVELPVNTPLIATIENLQSFDPPPELKKKRVFGQFRGMMKMSPDFNDPLPDSFWNGEE